MNSTRISHARLKVTESFSVPPTHSWLSRNNGYDSCEFKHSTGIFSFAKKNPSLISLILNTKSEMYALN